MTAWLEMSRVHFGMKEVFIPVLVEQILLCLYLFVNSTKTEVRVCVIAHFPSSFRARFAGFAHGSNIYSQNHTIRLLTPENLFPSLQHVILHEGHPVSKCPKLQNPLFQNAKENLLPGEKVPVKADEGWGKSALPRILTHRLRRSPLSRRDRVILSMMDSATPPCGCAQNDSIAGGIQVSDWNEGSPHSCYCGADFTHLTFPVCEQHEDRGGMCVIAHFPSHFPRGYSFCPFKQHSFTK